MVIPSGEACPFHKNCPKRVGDGYDNCPRGAGGFGIYICGYGDYLDYCEKNTPLSDKEEWYDPYPFLRYS